MSFLSCGRLLPRLLVLVGLLAPLTSRAITLDFEGMVLGAYFGVANEMPAVDGSCPDRPEIPGNVVDICYAEDGFLLGTLDDPVTVTGHVHRTSNAGGRAARYEGDAPGLFLRRQDGAAFSAASLQFLAPITTANPDAGANDFWEILGFDAAVKPGITLEAPPFATVAYQTVPNGFSGTLVLDPAFGNVKSIWIVYNGYYLSPLDGKAFEVTVDNVELGEPLLPSVAQVPLPAAAALLLALGLGTAGATRLRLHRRALAGSARASR